MYAKFAGYTWPVKNPTLHMVGYLQLDCIRLSAASYYPISRIAHLKLCKAVCEWKVAQNGEYGAARLSLLPLLCNHRASTSSRKCHVEPSSTTSPSRHAHLIVYGKKWVFCRYMQHTTTANSMPMPWSLHSRRRTGAEHRNTLQY